MPFICLVCGVNKPCIRPPGYVFKPEDLPCDRKFRPILDKDSTLRMLRANKANKRAGCVFMADMSRIMSRLQPGMKVECRATKEYLGVIQWVIPTFINGKQIKDVLFIMKEEEKEKEKDGRIPACVRSEDTVMVLDNKDTVMVLKHENAALPRLQM